MSRIDGEVSYFGEGTSMVLGGVILYSFRLRSFSMLSMISLLLETLYCSILRCLLCKVLLVVLVMQSKLRLPFSSV